jgi:hypothetical protein
VGPRPERPEFLNLFGSRLDRYDDGDPVKARSDGPAQDSGLRGNTSRRDRVEWNNHLTIGALFTGSRDA